MDSLFLWLGVGRGLPGLKPSFLGPPDQGKQGLAWLLGKQATAATAGQGYNESTGNTPAGRMWSLYVRVPSLNCVEVSPGVRRQTTY